jgi:hypothetical protein
MWPEMLNVTERAKAKLKELLESESDDRSVGPPAREDAIRGAHVFPDRERADNQVVEHDGATVSRAR